MKIDLQVRVSYSRFLLAHKTGREYNDRANLDFHKELHSIKISLGDQNFLGCREALIYYRYYKVEFINPF
jgi:hypothetical protein